MTDYSDSDVSPQLASMTLNVDNEDSLIPEDAGSDFAGEEPKSIILGLLAQIKKGVDLHKIPFPTFVLEPRSMLERFTDFVSHPQLILSTPSKPEGLDRFLDVLRHYLSGWHIRPKGVKKPYNPVLGEIFRCKWECPDSTTSYYISEQVSHHPPISAYIYANPDNGITAVGNFCPKPKFLGNSIVSVMSGQTYIRFSGRPGEDYICTYPNVYARGILFGASFIELGDDSTVTCDALDLVAKIHFKVKGYFSGSYNEVTAKVCQKSSGRVVKVITGKWTDKLYISDSSDNPKKALFLDLENETVCPKIVAPEVDQVEHESRRLWLALTEALKIRDYNKASEAKEIVENAQRHIARVRSEAGTTWSPKFFSHQHDGFWDFSDRHILNESIEKLKTHLEEAMSCHDFNFSLKSFEKPELESGGS